MKINNMKLLFAGCVLSTAMTANAQSLDSIPVLGGLLAGLGGGGIPSLSALPDLGLGGVSSAGSSVLSPLVSQVLGSEAADAVISGGIPVVGELLVSDAFAPFLGIGGQLLTTVSLGDILIMPLQLAPAGL